MRKRLLYSLCLPALAACMCASLNGGGSGTNTGNGVVVGKIVDRSGESVEGLAITLLPNDYLQAPPWNSASTVKPLIRETTTAFDGSFTIDSLTAGAYSIEANDHRGNAVLLKCSVIHDLPTALTEAALEPYATITGTVAVAPSGVRQFVQIYGLERCAAADSTGAYTFGNLPAGVYTLRIVCSDTTIAPVAIPAQQAFSGAVTRAPPAGWRFFKKIHLNTTTGGAGIAGSVTDFPVLVRLRGNTFDFKQAGAGGADIRFAKSNGSPLAREIESWDAGAGLAEVWVKVDTIYGDDSTQSITMYWGNPNASDTSHGPGAFDSASGFEGVWRLGETSGTYAADASRNGFAGTYKGGLPKNASGPFGVCQTIARPDSDCIDMGNVLNPGMKNFSVGAWVKPSAFGSPQALIAKTNGGSPSAAYGYLLSFDQANFPHFFTASAGTHWGDDGVFDIASNLAITDSTKWHYVFAVIDRSGNSNCKFYVDGIDRTGGAYGNVAHVNAIGNTLRLRIGTENDNNGGYKGAIAEATVAFTARSADWVKLSYMNQKEQDALVKW